MLKKNQELNDDLEVKISSSAKTKTDETSTISDPSLTLPKAKIIDREVAAEDKVEINIPAISTQIKTRPVNDNKGFTFSYILKYIIFIIPAIITAVLLGRGLSIILSNPLFFLELNLQNILLISIPFILFVSFLYLMGIFFHKSYIFLFISAFLLSIATVFGTSFTNNIYLIGGFGFGLLLVFLLFFINTETDIANQFSFKFFQSLRASHLFVTWFTICLSAILGLSLISTIGTNNYSLSDPIVDKVLGLVQGQGDGKNSINFNDYNKSLSDAQNAGIDLGVLKNFNPSISEMLLTPKEFLKNKLNEYVRSNSVIITIGLTLFIYFSLVFLFNVLSQIAKLLSYAIFRLLGLINFFGIEKVQKEAIVLKVN